MEARMLWKVGQFRGRMGYATYTVCLGDDRNSSGGRERVTILQHQHSLPQAPDFHHLQNPST
jgi:hypothetical protein